jgi:hypothetical protein
LDAVGGLDYLGRLVDSVPSTANLAYYIREVLDRWRSRQVDRAVHAMGRVVAEEPRVADQIDRIHGIASTIRPTRPEPTARASDRLAQIIADTASGKIRAIPLPWPVCNRLCYALLPETVTLLCGGLGASKSFALLQVLASLKARDVAMCIYELEESQEFHLRRYAAQVSRCPGLTNPDWIPANAEQAANSLAGVAQQIDEVSPHIWASPDSQPTLDQVARWVDDRARSGYRVIAVDPVTAAAHTNKSTWEEDNAFLGKVKRTASECQCSVVLVTHPTKGMAGPDVQQLAGSAAYARFAQTILWLEAHDDGKTGKVKSEGGTIEEEYNRTLHILKARNSVGQGARIACQFESESLTLREMGIAVKERKG